MGSSLGLKDGDLDINTFLKVMDVASAERKTREQVEQHLNFDEQKDDIRKRIQATAEVTGEKLRDEEIDAAIDKWYEGLYSFKEPKRSLGRWLANKYIDRGRITKTYVIPAAIVGAFVTGAYFTVTGIHSAHRRSLERGVEEQVEKDYQRRQGMGTAIANLSENESQKIRLLMSEATNHVNQTDDFFTKYCPEGQADDKITQENFETVESELPAVERTLDLAIQNINQSRGIIDMQQRLVLTRKSLDSLIADIRAGKPPGVLLDRGESAYQAGVAYVENDQIREAEQSRNQLLQVNADIKQFSTLPARVEQLYISIKSVVKEDKAVEQGESLYKEAKSYVQSVDIANLREAIKRMQDLDAVLNQAYDIRIVNRRGIKSGIDRYYTDERGKRASGFYLILEAVAPSGEAYPRQIINEENNRTETVKMWGERIPNAVYERVKRDKIDNGIINDNIFGRKKRGYITEEIIFKGPDGRTPMERKGQITRW